MVVDTAESSKAAFEEYQRLGVYYNLAWYYVPLYYELRRTLVQMMTSYSLGLACVHRSQPSQLTMTKPSELHTVHGGPRLLMIEVSEIQ
jgi:hypothetical protein